MILTMPQPGVVGFTTARSPPRQRKNQSHRLRRKNQSNYTVPAALPDGAQLEDTILIAGGGPAGLAAALALNKIGMKTLVLERSASLPTAGAALGLWTNAWKALDTLNAASSLREIHPVVSEVEICRQDGRKLTNFSILECDGGPHEFRGVRRASLVKALAAQLPEDSIEYNAAVVEVKIPQFVDNNRENKDLTSSSSPLNSNIGAEVRLSDGRRIQCAAIIGCDGARSPTAVALGKKEPSYAGQVAIRGVAQLESLQKSCPEIDFNSSIRQIWGAGPRAGMYPLSSSELYWFVCFDAPGNAAVPATPAEIKAEAGRIVKGWGWGVEAAVAATPEDDLSRSRIVDRWDVEPLFRNGSSEKSNSGDGGRLNSETTTNEKMLLPLATLAGDALHPMTPNLGQGGCTALEDGVILAQAVQKSGAVQLSGTARRHALEAAFIEYEKLRTQRCLPLTVRSNLMGAALQLPLPPVILARDWFVANLFNPGHFLDHATFDCGKL
jgi:2-polyprenyl-6-methoxyphenol hydroxylase-like FAD-dependent oxidoreductase